MTMFNAKIQWIYNDESPQTTPELSLSKTATWRENAPHSSIEAILCFFMITLSDGITPEKNYGSIPVHPQYSQDFNTK